MISHSPYSQVQLHVELLEGVKLHLDRLMRSSADSPVDLLALGLVLMDMKVQLMEDGMAVMRVSHRGRDESYSSEMHYLLIYLGDCLCVGV